MAKYRDDRPYDWELIAQKRINKLLNFENIYNREDYDRELTRVLRQESDKHSKFTGRNILKSSKQETIFNALFRAKDTQKRINKTVKSEAKRIKQFRREAEPRIPREARITNKDKAFSTKGIRTTIDKRGHKHHINRKGQYTKKPY